MTSYASGWQRLAPDAPRGMEGLILSLSDHALSCLIDDPSASHDDRETALEEYKRRARNCPRTATSRRSP